MKILILLVLSFITFTTNAANLLFKSNFGDGVVLGEPVFSNDTLAWQHFSGIDSETGYSWPITAFNASQSPIQMILHEPVCGGCTLDDYQKHEIQQVVGPNGKTVNVLNQKILKKIDPNTWKDQDPLVLIRPTNIGDTGDFYITYWYKHPENTADLLLSVPNGGHAMAQFAFKTGGYQGGWEGDFRTSIRIFKAML